MAVPSMFVRIPKERVGVLVGPEGLVKTRIEEKLKVKLQIDSETGNVDITLSPQTDDPSVLFRAREIVTAIGRGFSPEHAFRLLNDEEPIFELLDLHDVVGKSEADLKRVRGRVIGENGRTRRLIEELTETHVSV
ncbi:MAG: KH domain-containing protein, partial [Candidatus Bathyarchaeia archaeon]